jgi:exodeoxyribonuclease X
VEWRGKRWAEVDGGFLRWMTGNATMESDLKWNAQRELDRRANGEN